MRLPTESAECFEAQKSAHKTDEEHRQYSMGDAFLYGRAVHKWRPSRFHLCTRLQPVLRGTLNLDG